MGNAGETPSSMTMYMKQLWIAKQAREHPERKRWELPTLTSA